MAFFACKKKDSFTSATISDYNPLVTGKYIIYKLDSTVLPPFSNTFVTHTYQAKDSVEGQITDNLGRPAFRIIRFIRTDDTQPWMPNNTFMAVITGNTLEYTEDNLRFVKLSLPIKEGVSWKGNEYLTSDPYPYYQFDSDFMADWLYTYQQVGASVTLGANTFDDTITVFERDDAQGDPGSQPDFYAEKTHSIEQYAKGVGLIYKDFLHWEYQPPGGSRTGYNGFGITLTLVSHN